MRKEELLLESRRGTHPVRTAQMCKWIKTSKLGGGKRKISNNCKKPRDVFLHSQNTKVNSITFYSTHFSWLWQKQPTCLSAVSQVARGADLASPASSPPPLISPPHSSSFLLPLCLPRHLHPLSLLSHPLPLLIFILLSGERDT